MADSDVLPARGVPYRVTVDANGIALNGTANVLQLAQKGMRPVCLVDANGLSGAVTIDQLRSRGIRAACLVDENGLVGGVTADTLRSRGIRPLVSLTAAGLSGSTTMLQLAQRGLDFACLVGESGSAVPVNTMFGVNMSGPEFAPWNGQQFPTTANWNYLASLGVGFARLPIAWESIQQTLGGALDATYLGKIQTAIAGALAVGITTQVEIHNFGFYASQAKWTTTVGYAGNAGVLTTGVNVLGDGTVTAAHLADVWTKLATALNGTAGLASFGVMNEPAPGIIGFNMLDAPNYFGNSTGSKPWVGINAPAITQLAAGTNPLGAAFGPAWSLTSGTGFGGVQQSVTLPAAPVVISCWARCAAGTEGCNFGIGGTFGGFTATTTWTRYSFTRTPTAGANQCLISLASASGHTIQIANAQVELGATPTTYEPSPSQPYMQAAVNAIRAVNATIPIYICGYNLSLASRWLVYNYELASMTGGNLVFEAHQYFDGPQGVGGGGAYSGTFTSYGVDTATGAQCIANYLSWLTARSATGFLGEFGVVNNSTDNNPQWLPTQVNFLNALKTANCKGAQWFFGSGTIQPANNLNIATLVNDPRLTQMLAVL